MPKDEDRRIEIMSESELLATPREPWMSRGVGKCFRCEGPIEGVEATAFALADGGNPRIKRWYLWCDTCYFATEGDKPSMADRTYWIDANDLRTYEDYALATIHLGETKVWRDPQSWAQIGKTLLHPYGRGHHADQSPE